MTRWFWICLGIAAGMGWTVYRHRASCAHATGFAFRAVHVQGHRRTSAHQIHWALGLKQGDHMWEQPLDDMRERLESLPWVKTARVARLLPFGFRVHLTEREPMALWQKQGRLWVIDDQGHIIPKALPTPFRRLVIITGSGAPQAFPLLMGPLSLLHGPFKIKGATFLPNHRWDIYVRPRRTTFVPKISSVDTSESRTAKTPWIRVKLPEHNVAHALERFLKIWPILEREHAQDVDMRFPKVILFRNQPTDHDVAQQDMRAAKTDTSLLQKGQNKRVPPSRSAAKIGAQKEPPKHHPTHPRPSISKPKSTRLGTTSPLAQTTGSNQRIRQTSTFSAFSGLKESRACAGLAKSSAFAREVSFSARFCTRAPRAPHGTLASPWTPKILQSPNKHRLPVTVSDTLFTLFSDALRGRIQAHGDIPEAIQVRPQATWLSSSATMPSSLRNAFPDTSPSGAQKGPSCNAFSDTPTDARLNAMMHVFSDTLPEWFPPKPRTCLPGVWRKAFPNANPSAWMDARPPTLVHALANTTPNTRSHRAEVTSLTAFLKERLS